MKARQWPIIYRQLELHGEISRNFALRNYISRLAARKADLEEKFGWQFREERRDGDYVYVVTVAGRNHLKEIQEPKQLTMNV